MSRGCRKNLKKITAFKIIKITVLNKGFCLIWDDFK